MWKSWTWCTSVGSMKTFEYLPGTFTIPEEIRWPWPAFPPTILEAGFFARRRPSIVVE